MIVNCDLEKHRPYVRRDLTVQSEENHAEAVVVTRFHMKPKMSMYWNLFSNSPQSLKINSRLLKSSHHASLA